VVCQYAETGQGGPSRAVTARETGNTDLWSGPPVDRTARSAMVQRKTDTLRKGRQENDQGLRVQQSERDFAVFIDSVEIMRFSGYPGPKAFNTSRFDGDHPVKVLERPMDKQKGFTEDLPLVAVKDLRG